MAYSDELKARKRSYESDYRKLIRARDKLRDAKNELCGDSTDSLKGLFNEYLVIDDEYNEKESIKEIYSNVSDSKTLIDGYIKSVEDIIDRLEDEIREAEEAEAEDDD